MEKTQSSAELIELREKLGIDLKSAIINGDAERMVKMDLEMKSLSPRIFAAKIVELKANLKSNTERQKEVENEIEGLLEIRKEKNVVFARTIEVAEAAGLAVQKVEFAIGIANQEVESLRVSRREMNERLDDLKQEKLREIENYERLYQ